MGAMKTEHKLDVSISGVRSSLGELLRYFGYDPAAATVEEKQAIADRLSAIAKKARPWTWRYVQSVLAGSIEPSPAFATAVNTLGASLDGVPLEVATSRRVQVLAMGQVKPGSLVLADSRACANPACPIEFVPRTPNQRYHSAACRCRSKSL